MSDDDSIIEGVMDQIQDTSDLADSQARSEESQFIVDDNLTSSKMMQQVLRNLFSLPFSWKLLQGRSRWGNVRSA